MFFQMLYMAFWSKYLEEAPPEGLGLSISVIGLLLMIQRSQRLLFQLPGGILADRIGRKKVTLIAAATRMIMPLIYLWARSWELLAIGSIFGALSSLGMPAFQALIAESLPRDQMGSGYAIYGMVRRVPMLFTGIIGGIVMDTLGVGKGTRICLIGSFIGAVISFVARYLFLTETLVRRPRQRSSITEDFREVLPLFKGSLRGMLVTSAVSQFAGGMVMSLIILYIINVIGLSYTQWGFISSAMSIISLITAMPGGIMVDRFNRVKLIVFARAISPITTIGYIFLRDFWSILGVRMVAGVGAGLSGAGMMGWMGGPAWNSMMADIIPPEKRGRVQGLMGTISGLAALPAPYIGAYMWDSEIIGPENTMWASVIIGLSATVIFGKTVKDPKFAEQRIEEPARDDGEDEKKDKEGSTP